LSYQGIKILVHTLHITKQPLNSISYIREA